MSNTYGAPTNLDLSGCNVTATGGTTSQTIADLAKSVADANTNIATAVQNASSANTAAQAAQTTAQAAQTAVSNLGNTYIPQSAKDAAGGVVTYTSDGAAIIQSLRGNNGNSDTYLGIGSFNGAPASGNVTVAYRFSSVQANNFYYQDTKSNTNYQLFSGFNTIACPDVDGGVNIAEAGRAVKGIFSQTAVTVTSDATHKTVIGSLADSTYSDGQKLSDAIWTLDTETFKLNSSIADKGEDDARIHAGFIAQKVEAAIKSAGLDPSDYALWTNSPVYETVKTDTGKKDANGQPVYSVSSVQKTDSNGQPVTIQMLRYEQIFAILHESYKTKITALEARVAALEAKNTSSTSTTGSAS